MSSAAQSVSILMLIAAAGLGTVAAFVGRHRTYPGARGFSLAMFGAALWTTVLSINVWPTQFLPLHVSMTLRNGLILVILLGWFLLVVEYVRRERVSFRLLPVALVLVIPVLTVGITATNPYHHLAIGANTPAAVGGGSDIEWGPWHLVFMAYVFAVSIASLGFLLRDYRSAHGIHRRQLLLLLAGFAVGFVGVNDYLLTGAVNGVPDYVRVSPFAFLLTAGIWSVAVFRHRLFDLVPVSRRTVVETMTDPVIAVDGHGTIIDANLTARKLCNVTGGVAGMGLSEFCSERPQIREYYHNGDRSEEITVRQDGTERHFSARTASVDDDRDASIIVLRDVTELKAYERQLEKQRDDLEILNEIVRHDIRNDLMVIQGYAELLEESVPEQRQTAIDSIENSTESAIELTKKARELTEAMVNAGTTDRQLSLLDSVTRQVESIEREHQAAIVSVETPFPDVSVPADDMLESVFRNLLENAIKHNDKDVPKVTVSGETRDRTAIVRVADNGPGIHDKRKESVFGKGKKGLGSSGTGIGLYLVATLVTNYGGDVWIEDNDPEGAVFVVELPMAETTAEL